MKKRLCLLLAVLMLLTLTACKDGPPGETMGTTATIPTTAPTQPTVPETTAPTVPIQPTEPPEMHTVWLWTEQKLTKAEGGAGTYTREYDSLGRMIQDAYASADGKTSYRYSYTYDEADRILTYEEYDSRYATGRTEYTYDATGRLTKEIYSNTENYSSQTEYTYTTDGKITEKVTVSGKNKDRTLYTYDANGNLIREARTVSHNDRVTENHAVDYTYDEAGNKLTRTESREGTPLRVEEWTYSEAGQVLTYRELDGAGNVGEGLKYVYYPDGKVDEECFYIADTEELVTYYLYDDAGRVTKRASGKRYKYINVTEMTLYTYDENGNLLTEITTEKDGTELSRKEYTYISMEVPVK